MTIHTMIDAINPGSWSFLGCTACGLIETSPCLFTSFRIKASNTKHIIEGKTSITRVNVSHKMILGDAPKESCRASKYSRGQHNIRCLFPKMGAPAAINVIEDSNFVCPFAHEKLNNSTNLVVCCYKSVKPSFSTKIIITGLIKLLFAFLVVNRALRHKYHMPCTCDSTQPCLGYASLTNPCFTCGPVIIAAFSLKMQ